MIEKARQAYERGEYRWATQLLMHVVFAHPDNSEAMELQADAFEQLGYQAEAATWRNFYLMGAINVLRPKLFLMSSSSYHTLGEIAELHRGIQWSELLTNKGRETGQRSRLVRDEPDEGFMLGVPPKMKFEVFKSRTFVI